jgi:hypothetical protein
MGSVSSTSTDAQVRAALDDNASFQEDESLAKAKAYLTAIRVWRQRLALSARAGDGVAQIQRELLWCDTELERVHVWIMQNGGASTAEDTAPVSLAAFDEGRI